MVIIGLSGKRGTGKSTLRKILCDTYGYKSLSFAKALKDMAKASFGLDEEHVNGGFKEVPLVQLNGYTPRELMMDLGQVFRRYDSDYWVKLALRDLDDKSVYVVDDLRFPNELEHIKKYPNVLVRLNRDSDLNIYKGESTDPSEVALDHYEGWNLEVKKESNKTVQNLTNTASYVALLAETLRYSNDASNRVH